MKEIRSMIEIFFHYFGEIPKEITVSEAVYDRLQAEIDGLEPESAPYQGILVDGVLINWSR